MSEVIIAGEPDLEEWQRLPGEERAAHMKKIFMRICESHHIQASLSFSMPAGFASAFGLYDDLSGTVYVNRAMLDGSVVDALFYFFHELRHCMQYKCRRLFAPEIVHSLQYIIQYDGTCFKREDSRYLRAKLEGNEAYFTELYLAQPHELDANTFAFNLLESCRGASQYAQDIDRLRALWLPKYKVTPKGQMPGELKKVFRRIDIALHTC